jgi:hypothetical protein
MVAIGVTLSVLAHSHDQENGKHENDEDTVLGKLSKDDKL